MRVSKLLTTILVGGMLAGCASHKYQVYFKPGSSELSASSKATVMEAASILKRHKHASAKLSGFTDGTGSSELNKKLAMKRINSVDNMLIASGVDSRQVNTSTTGKKWLYYGEPGDDMSQRRVDIRIFRW